MRSRPVLVSKMQPLSDIELRPSRKSRGGFTLIELLVVVAIIALLIALLVPSLSAGREQAKSSTCKANLRSVMTAYRIYADEYGGAPPGMGSSMEGTTFWDFFYTASSAASPHVDVSAGFLSPYLGKIEGNTLGSATVPCGMLKATLCPSMILRLPSWARTRSGFPGTGPSTSYVLQTGAMGSNFKISNFTQPADTLMFTDAEIVAASGNTTAGNMTSPAHGATSAGPFSVAAGASTPAFRGIHNKIGNIAWVDGHVTSERPYLNSAMPTYSLNLAETVGFPIPLPPSTSWANFLSSVTFSGPANANYYFWVDKNAMQ